MSLPLLLTPYGIPRRGLVCHHRLWFPNILQYSEQFNQTSAWTKSAATVSSNAVACPHTSDGFSDKLVEDGSAAAAHNVLMVTGVPATTTYTLAWVAKAAERSWLMVRANSQNSWFDIGNGVLGTAGAGHTNSITALGDGWYLCSMVSSISSGFQCQFRLATGDTVQTYDGDGSSGLYLARSQLYPSATLPAYQVTTTLQTAESGLIDLTGNGYHLQRGATTGAEASDPTVLGPGLSFDGGDGAFTADIGINKNNPFTILFPCKPSGSSGTLIALTDSATASTKFQRLMFSAGNAVKAGSAAGGAESLSDALTVDGTAYQVLALTSDGTTLTAKRMDTGASVTVADTNPDGNARLGIGCTAGSTPMANLASALIALEPVAHNRLLSNAEIQRAYRAVKSVWAGYGVTVL